jgi:hypothetical protein
MGSRVPSRGRDDLADAVALRYGTNAFYVVEGIPFELLDRREKDRSPRNINFLSSLVEFGILNGLVQVAFFRSCFRVEMSWWTTAATLVGPMVDGTHTDYNTNLIEVGRRLTNKSNKRGRKEKN